MSLRKGEIGELTISGGEISSGRDILLGRVRVGDGMGIDDEGACRSDGDVQ